MNSTWINCLIRRILVRPAYLPILVLAVVFLLTSHTSSVVSLTRARLSNTLRFPGNDAHQKQEPYTNNQHHTLHFADGDNKTRCDSLLVSGRYFDADKLLPRKWQPDGCLLHPYQDTPDSLQACLEPGDEIIVAGDETAKQVFYGFLHLLAPQKSYAEVDDNTLDDLDFVLPTQVRARFLAMPYLNGSNAAILADIANNGTLSEHKVKALELAQNNNRNKSSPRTYLFVSGGLHFFSKATNDQLPSLNHDFIENLGVFLTSLLDPISQDGLSAFERIFYAPPQIPYYPVLNSTNKQAYPLGLMTNIVANIDNLLQLQKDPEGKYVSGGVIYKDSPIQDFTLPKLYYVSVFNDLAGVNHAELYDSNGFLYIEQTRLLMTSILMSHMCNQRLAATADPRIFKGTCCVDYTSISESSQISYKVMIMLVIFFTVLFVAIVSTLDKTKALSSLLIASALSLLATILAVYYAYLAERTQKFAKLEITPTPYLLAVLLQTVVFLGLFSLGPTNTPTPYLKELQGVCLLLLLAVEISGYNTLDTQLEGAVLARVALTCWSALEVYNYARRYIQRFTQSGFALISLINFSVACILRLFVLPALISLAVVPYSSSALTEYAKAFSMVSPVSIKLMFWYIFVTIVIPLVYVLTILSLKVVTQTDKIQTYRLFLYGIQAMTFVIISMVVLIYKGVSSHNDKTSTWIHYYNQQSYTVAGDFGVVLFTVMTAWFVNSREIFNQLLEREIGCMEPHSEEVLLSKWKILEELTTHTRSISAVFVCVLGNYLFYAFKFPTPYLADSGTFASLPDESLYASSLRNRGAAYTPLVHTVVCLSILLLWVHLRCHGSTPKYAARAYVFIASCGFELLALRQHILATTFGNNLLSLLSSRTGQQPRMEMPMDVAYSPNGAVDILVAKTFSGWGRWFSFGENLVMTSVICIALAKACGVVWEHYLSDETREEEAEGIEAES